jgi:hypothetical protein
MSPPQTTATLSHRMGEGLGVRAAGIAICVYLRNPRSSFIASFAALA